MKYSQWVLTCDSDQFSNYSNKSWDAWHQKCAQWTGPTEDECTQCSSGFFMLNGNCVPTCPDGFYADDESKECKPCHEWWSVCYGPTRFEWTTCNPFYHNLISINDEWKIPVCLQGEYYNDISCKSWGEGCKSCDYPNYNYCNKCSSIHLMLTPGECTPCLSVPGYIINEFGVWVEQWGDGINLGHYECDDGNLKNGDGWSNKCMIETGYACNGTLWHEIIKPTAVVSSVTDENIVEIVFSELVLFKNHTLFMNSLKVSIKGPSAPYKFDFQVIEDVESMEFKNFTTLHIQISNIKATIFGGGKEQVVFEFYDPSALTDLNYNPIASSKIMGNLNPYEYITPGTLHTLIV